MKNLLVAAFSLLLFTVTAAATAAPESPFHVGVMLGEITLDIQSHDYDAENTSNLEAQDSQHISLMINGGYSILDWLAVEAQYATMLGADEVYGEVRTSYTNSAASDFSTMEISTTAAGVYAVFQYPGPFYAKARFGIASSTAKFETDFASESYSSTHLSYGFSLGQEFGIGSLEFTYMRYPDVQVSRQDFEEVFMPEGGTGDNRTGVTVARRLTHEILAIGYIFKF